MAMHKTQHPYRGLYRSFTLQHTTSQTKDSPSYLEWGWGGGLCLVARYPYRGLELLTLIDTSGGGGGSSTRRVRGGRSRRGTSKSGSNTFRSRGMTNAEKTSDVSKRDRWQKGEADRGVVDCLVFLSGGGVDTARSKFVHESFAWYLYTPRF